MEDHRTLRLAQKLVRQSSIDFFDQKVVDAALKARKQINCDRAIFGDCLDVSKRTIVILSEIGISAKLEGGQFITNFDDDEEWDHSWVVVDDEILDPTVDQFFSSLDVDLVTTIPGIYYSSIDDDWLRERYKVHGAW